LAATVSAVSDPRLPGRGWSIVVGVWFVVIGVFEIVSSFSIRKASKTLGL
jgi:uncharacterized membrane protein HdeD (DUF308 family)